MALDFQRPDPSSPAAVAAAQFTLSRRGYREEEVRDFLRQVSVEMARLLERERFLESELKAMQARGPIDVGAIDEDAVTELLGAEAARILSVAREAAQAMRTRAAESAEQVVRERLRIGGVQLDELQVDYIGMNSLHGAASLPTPHEPYEVRLRFAGRAKAKRDAVKLAGEVETLVGKGPAMSSLPRTTVREVLAIYSVLIPRAAVQPQLLMLEAA